jgi:hypothetical protein
MRVERLWYRGCEKPGAEKRFLVWAPQANTAIREIHDNCQIPRLRTGWSKDHPEFICCRIRGEPNHNGVSGIWMVKAGYLKLKEAKEGSIQ